MALIAMPFAFAPSGPPSCPTTEEKVSHQSLGIVKRFEFYDYLVGSTKSKGTLHINLSYLNKVLNHKLSGRSYIELIVVYKGRFL